MSLSSAINVNDAVYRHQATDAHKFGAICKFGGMTEAAVRDEMPFLLREELLTVSDFPVAHDNNKFRPMNLNTYAHNERRNGVFVFSVVSNLCRPYVIA